MDIIIQIIEPVRLGNLKDEKVTGYKIVPLYNDYEKNPILTYLPVQVEINNKLHDCTEFHMNNGLSFISPVAAWDFKKVKKSIEDIQKMQIVEKNITTTWKSNYLQNGNSSLILN